MVDSASDELVAAYLADRNWDEQRSSVEKTAGIVQDLAAALLEASEIGQQELTALYRVCMNNSTYPVSSKRGEIDELDIPADVKQDLKERLAEDVGTVGGLLFPIEIPDEGTEEVTACFETLVNAEESEAWDDAVRRLAELELPNVKCGKLSPILSYLHPEYYPVVNTMSRTGLAEYFDLDVSNGVAEFPETAATYRSIRDEYGFKPNFRDLDYFFVWANNREKEREGVTLDDDRSYFWVNQSNQSEIEDEYLRAKVDDVWHHDLTEVSQGDVVFHNFDDELIGLSSVSGPPSRYEFRDEEYHRVPVDFEWFAEPVPVDAELKDSLDDPEWHQKYYPVDSNGNLKQAYLSQLSLAAAESLLDTSEAWNLIQPEGDGPGGEIPDAPDQADEIARQLQEKKQAVFYGPPGTGKTYTAERFAKWWVGQQDGGEPVSERVATVTFHPSFTYEDFIEGLSAKTGDDGQVAYEVQDGALKRLQAAAMDAYERAVEAGTQPDRYVLIIDEINRGNLAQIFGEVITLLEADKRGSFDVELAHSGETFTLPPNLYVIGTMNTADQSIALVDTALRRRFRFLDFPPDLDLVWALDDMVAPDAYTAITQPDEQVSRREQLLGASAAAVKTLNDRILGAPELGKGKQLGHTYLLGHESATDVVDAWRYDILPQLEEYYFGQFDRLRDDLLSETGERLIQWEAEQIKPFRAEGLYVALCQLAGIEDPAPLADERVEALAADGTGETAAKDAWDAGDKTVEGFRDRISRTLEPQSQDRVERLLAAGEDLGRIDTGGGDHTATAQLKSDRVDPGVGPIQIEEDGTVKFRLAWLAGRDENGLTGEMINEAAEVFDEIAAYSHEWRPDAAEDEKEFIVSKMQIADLSDAEMDTLVEGYRSFVQQADEFQHG